MKRWMVGLEPEERERLGRLVRGGKAAAYKIRHANMLLAVDEADGGRRLKDEEVARAQGVSVRSLESLRKRFVEDGLDACLERKKQVRPSVEPMFDGEKEAKLIAIACGPKPEGRARWTLELLADRAVALKIVEHCSAQTVMRTLKKTRSSRGSTRCGVSRRIKTRSSSVRWKTCSRYTPGPTTRIVRWSASTKKANNSSRRSAR